MAYNAASLLGLRSYGMVSEPTIAPKGNGLNTALDIIASPSDAFARLRVVPTWGWAFLIAAVLCIIGSFMGSAAAEHAAVASIPAAFAKNAQLAALPPEKRQQMIEQQIGITKSFSKFSFVLAPIILLITALLQTVYLLILNAATRGQGNFKKFWALSINISIVGSGLTLLIAGIIELIRGPEAFNSTGDTLSAIPGLAWIIPGTTGFLHGILLSFTVFSLWATGLFALGLIAIARIKPVQAYVGAAILLVIGSLITGSLLMSQV